jgi:DNA-binding NarL/FixJ family response regulator
MKPKASVSSGAPRKRILLVDDHPLMREGVAQWIRRASDLEVCGEAETAAAAMTAIEKLKPDLVLTDISLPGRSGIELIKDLQVQHPKVPVLVLSMHDESLYAGRALRAGARGYLMKRAGGERLVQGIREVLAGRIAVTPDMATLLLEEYSGRHPRSGRSPLPHLTDREFEVFQLLGEARSNREIAAQLHLSPKTVETHRLNLMRKLKARNTAELMRFAFQYVENEVAGNAAPTAETAEPAGSLPSGRKPGKP